MHNAHYPSLNVFFFYVITIIGFVVAVLIVLECKL